MPDPAPSTETPKAEKPDIAITFDEQGALTVASNVGLPAMRYGLLMEAMLMMWAKVAQTQRMSLVQPNGVAELRRKLGL